MNKNPDRKSMTTFYGVGLGPGDPELLTLKALRIIKESPVIAVPCAKNDGVSTAEGILRRALSLAAFNGEAGDALINKELLKLVLPMTRDGARLAEAREAAAEGIAQRLSQGKNVVFITLGDPMFYSTFSGILPYVMKLCPGSGVLTIPGVMALNAASAAFNAALAEGDDKVAIVPASYNLDEARAALETFETVVLMKVSKVLDLLIDLLDDMGLTERAVFISKASWADEEIVRDLTKLRGTRPGYFSMIIVSKSG